MRNNEGQISFTTTRNPGTGSDSTAVSELIDSVLLLCNNSQFL